MLHILIGKPGAGKGTQANLLKERLGYHVASMGELLRSAALVDKNIAEIQARGELVPEDVCINILKNALRDITFDNTPIILDGFPRNLIQARALNNHLVSSVIYLTLPDHLVVKRLRARGRSDDNEQTIRHRMQVYSEQTEPVLKFYMRGGDNHKTFSCLYHTIDGDNNPEEVYYQLVDAIKKCNSRL